MKFTSKITILVALQITLIVASFLVIVYFESQTNLVGNQVNVAGKNRVMASMVQIELNHLMFYGEEHGNRVFAALGDLEYNIHFLKQGGLASDVEIPPLAPRYDAYWNDVVAQFEQYDGKVMHILSLPTQDISIDDIMDAERIGGMLVTMSDILTKKLGDDVDELSDYLVLLQVVLGTVNVTVHILMIMFILRIFGRHTEEKVRTERFATVGEFASLVAHDLRNPLGVIRNSMIIIKNRNRGQNDTIESECARIDRAVDRMSHQIYGVLNYARDVPLVLDSHSIRYLLDRATDTMTIPENITVELPENDAVIMCDLEKIEFVFVNLILNAIQAIKDEKGSIRVRLKDGDGEIMISFENSGADIPKKDMPRIFEPMFTTKMQGTGLGLVSCRNVVRRHGGSITASNDPVTFTITIPKSPPSRP